MMERAKNFPLGFWLLETIWISVSALGFIMVIDNSIIDGLIVGIAVTLIIVLFVWACCVSVVHSETK